MTWKIEFWADDDGRQPARTFLNGLEPAKKMAMIAAIELILAPRGLDVCQTEYGRPLGDGLFEFRLRHDESTVRRKAGLADPGDAEGTQVLLRLFFHAYGEKIVLLLGGYDKGADSSSRRQTREINRARKSLRSFELRQQRQSAGARRRGKR